MEVSTAITKRRQKRVYFRDATRGGKAATLTVGLAKPVAASPAWPCGSAFLAGSRPVLAESAKSNRYNAMSRPGRELCRRYLLRSRKLVFSLPQHSARTWCRLVSWPMCEPEGADTARGLHSINLFFSRLLGIDGTRALGQSVRLVRPYASAAAWRIIAVHTLKHSFMDSPFPLATASSFSRKKYSSLNSYL